jgi:serine/threonine protein kinase
VKRKPGPPPELAGFEFVRLIATGGFSDVFLYQQLRPRRLVAVKVLVERLDTEAKRAVFDAEADLTARLSAHSSVVSIYQADVADDGRPYFVMEYYAQGSLAELYKSAESVPLPELLRTMIGVSSAVHTAHLAGILHRDIKPGNILYNDYGRAGLTDFGIASATPEVVGDAEGSVGLSVPWAPPEAFDDPPPWDVRSDVYSLGATMHTALLGRTPFERTDAPNGEFDLIGRILRGAVTPLTRGDLPRSLMAVLRKAMSVDREERFATAQDFARALQRVELELGYGPTPLEVPEAPVPPRPAAPRDDDELDERTVVASDLTRRRAERRAAREAQPPPPPPPPPLVSPPSGGRPPAPPASAGPKRRRAAGDPPFAKIGPPPGFPVPDAPSAPDRWELLLSSTGTVIPVEGRMLLGRDPEPEWIDRSVIKVAIDDPTRSVSKTHALISLEDDVVHVIDLGSANGVYVTEPRGEVAQLEPHAKTVVPDAGEIELGVFHLVVRRVPGG